MKKYSNYKSNYDKYPVVQVSETSENVCWQGWPEIVSQLNKSLENVHKPVKVLVVECYQGVYDEEVKSALKGQLSHTLWLDASSAMKTSEEINSFLKSDITDDEIFGYMTRYHMDCYFVNPEKRNEPSCKNEVVQNLQKRSVQKSTSAQYKKAPKKTYFFGAFLLLVFWLSHQKSLTLNNKEYIIFGF